MNDSNLNFIAKGRGFIISFLPVLIFIQFKLNALSPLPPIQVTKQISSINFENNFWNYFNLGQRRLLSDILWIKTLLDSDLEHYKSKDLNSWMYLRFETITSLDPLFLAAYRVGGQYLSVVKDDVWGAERIFGKGLRYYPGDFDLNFYGGMNSYFELNNLEGAFNRFSRIIKHPYAPKYLPSLLARLKAKAGDLEVSFFLLKSAYELEPDISPMKERYRQSLYALKAEMDLNCLNNQLGEETHKCSVRDFSGHLYKKDSKGKYIALEEWSPFRPFSK